jgi:tetratricopeptide (TPR) repeat protein
MGIVHRDIKPSNLILECSHLAPRDAELLTTDHGPLTTPRLWITDFGLARIDSGEAPGLTMTGDLLGTLRYMSPEQALAKRIIVDHRTDIYSLGITLYELLALQPAFNGADREEVLRQIAFEDPTPLRRLKPAIPVELETIIHKSISKNPDDRYATARELAEDLARFRTDQAIRAKPPTRAQKLVRWSRRHRAAVAVAIAMLFALIAITAFIQWRARAEVEVVLDELQGAQRRTQHSLQIARKAVDDMYTLFAHEWLSDEPRLTKTVEEFHAKAVRAYESLTEQFPADRELKTKAAIAMVLHAHHMRRLVGIRDQTASTDRALALAEAAAEGPPTLETVFGLAFTRTYYFSAIKERASPHKAATAFRAAVTAINSLELLVAQDSGNAEALNKLAIVQGNLVKANKEAPTAPNYALRAVQTAEKWVELQPDNEKALGRLVYCLNLAWNYGHGDSERALEIAERLIRLRSSHENRSLLADALLRHAFSVGRDNGVDLSLGVELSQRAIEILERTTEEFPDIGTQFDSLNDAYNWLCRLRLRQGNVVAAEEVLRKSFEMNQRLLARMPTDRNYRHQVLDTYRWRAALLWLLERPEKSQAIIEEASRVDLAWVLKYGDATTPAAGVDKNNFATANLLILAAKENPLPEPRRKLVHGAIAFLERSSVLTHEEIAVLREAVTVMNDKSTVDELLRDRWPGSETARLDVK